MADLVAWLSSELTRIEGLARVATPGPWQADADEEEIQSSSGTVARMRDFVRRMSSVQVEADMHLIVGVADPTVVLRRVAADRQILAEHADDGCGDCTVCARPSEETNGRGHAFFEPLPWPCRTVRLLADGYGWEQQ